MGGRIFFLVGTCVVLFAAVPSFAQERLRINEVMANPSGGQFPEVEWIELYNPSDYVLSLQGYTLHYITQSNTRSFDLPDLFLGAKQYALLCSQSAAPQLEPYGNVVALSSWPTLSNTGATLLLSQEDQGVVDRLVYSNRWYTTAQKRNGGWSLERLNPDLSCAVPSNWQESRAVQGGTPGRRNSVFDLSYYPALQILSSQVADGAIDLLFSHPVENILSVDEAYVDLDGARVSLQMQKIEGDRLTLHTESSLQPHVAYNVFIQGSYCDRDIELEQVLFESQEAMFNDVIVNEVLFNPKPGGVDFVELYNRSDKTYNLQGWRIGNRLLSNGLWLLDPREYVVVTTDDQVIREHYPDALLDRCIVLPSLPAYANERGVVTISDQTGVLIDSLYYTSAMHQPFLSNPRGVSLERQSFDRETNEPDNFASSATASGGATPGYANSRQEGDRTMKNIVFLENKVVSPDGDGKDDVLLIGSEISIENAMLTLHIYDDRGRLIRQLVRNQSIGFLGQISWDGEADDGAACTSGTYVMRAEVYNDQGVHHVFKEAFVLLRTITDN